MTDSKKWDPHAGKIDTLVALKLDPKDLDGPLILIVKGMRWQRTDPMKAGDTDDDRSRYFYEEHTCPENILHSTVLVLDGDDSDPHGLFRYLCQIDYDDALKERIAELDRRAHGCLAPEEADRLCNLSADSVRQLFGGALNGGSDD